MFKNKLLALAAFGLATLSQFAAASEFTVQWFYADGANAYNLFPSGNEDGYDDRQYFAENVTDSLYSGQNSQFQNYPTSSTRIEGTLDGWKVVSTSNYDKTTGAKGLWDGVIDPVNPNRPATFNGQKGQILYLAARIKRSEAFRMKDVVYSVASTDPTGLLAVQKDMANQPNYILRFINGTNWGADGIPRTQDDISYGNNSLNTAPVNDLLIVYYGLTVNLDLEAGSSNDERLQNALKRFAAKFDITPSVTVYANDDSRTSTPFVASGPALTINPTTPVFETQPTSLSKVRGHQAAFTVAMTGFKPPTGYQWIKDGIDIVGATNASYVIDSVVDSDAGNFSVKVTNPYGQVISDVVTLTVTPVPPPTATTSTASATSKAATLSGNIDAQGETTGTYRFAFGDDATVSETTSPTALTGSGSVIVRIENLIPNTTYFYRLETTTNGGTAYGAIKSFTTSFLDDPYTSVVGTFKGLIGDEVGPHGSISIKVTRKGAFTGTALFGSVRYALKGQLDREGNFSGLVSGTSLVLDLSVDVLNGSDKLEGSLSDDVTRFAFTADRYVFNKTLLTTWTGVYNTTLEPSEVRADLPSGDGLAIVKVSKFGNVRIVGSLADGTLFSSATILTKAGSVPVYIGLYQGRGSLSGSLAFASGPQTDVTGPLSWNRPQTSAGFYSFGFHTAVAAMGSLNVPPGRRMSSIPEGTHTVSLGLGNLSSELNLPIVVTGTRVTTFDLIGTHTALKINAPPSGVINGSFKDPETGKKRSIKGIWCSKTGASGYFLGENRGGWFGLDQP